MSHMYMLWLRIDCFMYKFCANFQTENFDLEMHVQIFSIEVNFLSLLLGYAFYKVCQTCSASHTEA